MMKWFFACIAVWAICIVGFFVIWLVGLSANCVFISGCMSQLDFETLLAAVDRKSVLVRGTLSAIAIVGIVWASRRRR